MRTLFIALLAALILVGCSESPSPLSPDTTEPVSKYIYSMVLTDENMTPGDARTSGLSFWLVPIEAPLDSVQVTVMAQMYAGGAWYDVYDCYVFMRGGVAVFRLTGRVEAGCQIRVLVIDMRYKIVAEHNQGGSW